MVSPRWDRWVVTADKPSDQQEFERVAKLPFEEFSASLGYGRERSKWVYELFETVEQANAFADEIRGLGATNIKVSPPRIPPEEPLPTVDRKEAARRLRDFLSE